MQTIELNLTDETAERIRRLAEARSVTLETLIEEFVARHEEPSTTKDLLTGMLADEPELADSIVESAMEARERDPLRRGSG